MRRAARWGAGQLAGVTALALVAVISASGATSGGAGGRSAGAAGARVGTPQTGAHGIQRTTAEIAALQKQLGHRPAHTLPERETTTNRRPNPDSPDTTDAKLGAALAAGPKVLSVGSSFTGTTFSEADSIPPDSMGAVGPSQFLMAVNGRIKVFSKAGAVGSLNADLDTFFSTVISSGAFTADPHVRYDPLSGKWFVLCIDAKPPDFVDNRVLLAVSDGDTITSGTVWTFFQFQGGDATTLADFPTIGIDANALYVGANVFDSAGDFQNTKAFVIRKSSVTGAGPIVVTTFSSLLTLPSGAGPLSPQGVDNLNPAATEGYFVGTDGELFGKLDVRRVSTPGGTPTLSGNLAITVASTALPLNPTVPGSSKPLDGLDDRLTSSSIRAGKLYTAHNIGVSSTGAASFSPTRDAVRWYELSNLTSTPTLSRSGTIFDSGGRSFWMPSLAVSGQGHALIGMSTAGSSARPNGAVSSMLKTETAFGAPTNYTASSQNYNVDTGDPVYRWGDFSHTSVDPCDGQTFWTIQEYVDATDDWGVRIGKVAAPPPATPASISPSSVAASQASVSVTLTGTAVSGSGFFDPGSGTCRVGAAVDGGVTVNSTTFTDATHLTLNVSTVGATAGNRTITITNPDGQTKAAAVFVVSGAPSNAALPTISGTTTVGSTLTSTTGTWNGFPAPTFTRQWERCDSGGASCVDIPGATATTYVLVTADGGSTIRVRVTATNSAGSSSAESAQTAVVAGPPFGTAVPVVTGTAASGQTLSTTNGTWGGSPAPTFAYAWLRCDQAGGSCAAIGAAAASTYGLVAADVGKTIRSRVTATNASGSASQQSAQTAIVTGPPVAGTPTISGTAKVGQTLTAATGTWGGYPAPTFTYQWQRCSPPGTCADIGGATASTYVLASADGGKTVRVQVTGTNGGGSATGTSAETATVTVPPLNTSPPTISGTASLGKMLTASAGAWDGAPAPTFTYQWQRCSPPGTCTNITGATATTYTLGSADVRMTVRVHVTGTNSQGSSSANSAETAAVTSPPVNTALPTISGPAQVGATLTAANGTWTGFPAPTFTYQWERCDGAGANCADIGGATGQTYDLVVADAGKRLRVQVTGTNSVIAAAATSAATATITVPPSNDTLPTIAGTAAVGSTLTGNDGIWSGSPTPTLTRKWRRCDTGGASCADIAGATATTYVLVQADAGSTIRLRVTGASTSGTTTADSAATAVVTGPPVNSALPAITGTASRGQLLTASTGTWSGSPAPSFGYQWRRCDTAGANCVDVGGATASTYTPVTGDQGHKLRVVVTGTNGSGSAAATSDATGTVTGSPENSVLPAVSGTAAKGEVLSTTAGTWSGFPATFTFAYAWLRCDDSGGAGCVAILGATASSYTLVQADVGHTIRSRVTTSNGVSPGGTAESALTAFVAGPPANTAAPTLTGTTGVGDTLTAANGTWTGFPAPTFADQWQRCDSDGSNCADIAGETAGTYVIAAADRGYRLRVEVTATNGSGSASAVSATKDVAGPPVSLAPPSITGSAQVGSTLTAAAGSWAGVPAPAFTYQWQRCDETGLTCADIGGANGSTYVPVAADVGSKLLVLVSASNAGGSAGPAASALTATVVAAPSGGGGGGGAAGGLPPDAAASITAEPASPKVGDTLSYLVTASVLTGAAEKVVATINLPSQVTFVSSAVNRGPGCSGITTLTCDLAFLSGRLVGTVRIVTTVQSTGSLVASVSLTTKPGDPKQANNTASVTTVVAEETPPANEPPALRRVGKKPLTGTRRGATESVAARFSVSEAARLQLSVTRAGSSGKLTLLAGSRLAGTTAASRRRVLTGRAADAGTYSLRAVLARSGLVRGRLYVLHLTATDGDGKQAKLAIRFRA